MGNSRTVDFNDNKTSKLIRSLIGDEIALARSRVDAGRDGETREKLLEVRAAALKVRLYEEVVKIDDLLLKL